MTKLENCLKCQHNVSYKFGFVMCNYWKQNQQHVTSQGEDGVTYVVGCTMKAPKRKVG